MPIVKRNNGNGSVPVFRSLVSDLFNTDRFFSDFFNTEATAVPAVNVKERDKTYEIEVASPGLKKDDFQISVDNGILTIAAEKEEKKTEEKENYTRQEFSYNSFSRSFSIPENVKDEDIQAKYEDGVLKLTLNKKETTVKKAKAIKVG